MLKQAIKLTKTEKEIKMYKKANTFLKKYKKQLNC